MSKNLYSWNSSSIFHNCKHLSSNFRMLLIGPSGVGKTSLLIKLLLDKCEIHNKDYLDFKTLVLCSPSLSQMIYKVIIGGFNSGLDKNQLKALFHEQKEITNLDLALKTIKEKNNVKNNPYQVVSFNSPDELITPEELSKKYEKILIIFDDSMNLSQDIIQLYFSYGRALKMNVIFISQAFTKIKKAAMREQCNF